MSSSSVNRRPPSPLGVRKGKEAAGLKKPTRFQWLRGYDPINMNGATVKSKVGQLTIQKFIGEGSFGYVYTATDKHGKKYILKIPKARISKNFRRSSEYHKKISSRNRSHIVSHLSEGMITNKAGIKYEFMMLEYMDNGDLLSNLNSEHGTSAKEQAHNLLNIAIGAKVFLKLTGKDHKDIKFENVLMNSSGDIKLADIDITSPNAWDFTPPYKPKHHGDHDVFSIGMMALMYAAKSSNPKAYNQLRDDLANSFKTINNTLKKRAIEKCMKSLKKPPLDAESVSYLESINEMLLGNMTIDDAIEVFKNREAQVTLGLTGSKNALEAFEHLDEKIPDFDANKTDFLRYVSKLAQGHPEFTGEIGENGELKNPQDQQIVDGMIRVAQNIFLKANKENEATFQFLLSRLALIESTPSDLVGHELDAVLFSLEFGDDETIQVTNSENAVRFYGKLLSEDPTYTGNRNQNDELTHASDKEKIFPLRARIGNFRENTQKNNRNDLLEEFNDLIKNEAAYSPSELGKRFDLLEAQADTIDSSESDSSESE